MCSPALGTMGAQAMGVGMSTVGAYFGAKSEKAQLRHRAAMADINASISDSNARNTIYAGTVEESRVKLAGAQAKGQQRNQIAGSGITMDSTSALARLTGTDLITEVDANMVRANALRAAWGQRMEAGNQRSAANAARAQASSISSTMAGATSLISGAGAVAASWYSLDKQGAFDKTGSKKGKVSVMDGQSDIPGAHSTPWPTVWGAGF